MIYVAQTNEYVSGVFENRDQAEEYLHWCNVGFGVGNAPIPHHLVETGCLRYPFFAVERGRGNFEFYQELDLVPKDIAGAYTLYRFKHGFQTPECGHDFMGLLDHEHFGDDDDQT